MRIVGRVIKYTVIVLIFAVIFFLLWRAFFSDIMPKSMEELIVTDSLKSAYADGGITLKYQKLDHITRVQLTEKEEREQERLSNYGYFAITRVDIIPEADQVQVVFRYNNSTLRALKDDYGLSNVPPRDADLYDLSIVLATDLTPDNDKDNLRSDAESVALTRYFPTKSYTVTDEKNMYNYRKFVFEGVSIEELTLALYVDIYYNEDINYDKIAYGTLCIWDHITEEHTRELSGDDIKKLTGN